MEIQRQLSRMDSNLDMEIEPKIPDKVIINSSYIPWIVKVKMDAITSSENFSAAWNLSRSHAGHMLVTTQKSLLVSYRWQHVERI